MTTPAHIGPYIVQAEMGQDGIALRYHARHANSERDVTLRVFARQVLPSATYDARLRDERKPLLATDHAALVPIYDIGEDGDLLYIATQALKGGTLDERITSGPLPRSDLLAIVARVAAALDYLHGLGIVHRNLRPSSIYFDDGGQAVLGNAGEITLPEVETVLPTRVMLDAMAYMSPEQIEGTATLTAESDVYALGVIVFEMLSGQRPFTSTNPSALAGQHIAKPPPTIRETLLGVLPGSPEFVREQSAASAPVPPGVEMMLAKALAKSPAARFARASELASELARQLERTRPASEQDSASQPSASQQSWDWDK